MSQVFKINGDYKIKTDAGGVITLDTGQSTGSVVVTGDLVVQGDRTDVEVGQLKVEDNIISLNTGETGAGVTLNYSGIEIERGSVDNASFVFDESTDTWLLAKGQNGSYTFADSTIKLRTVLFNNDVPDSENLYLTTVGVQGGATLRINNIPDYYQFVVNDDDIPNKKYVDDQIQNNPTFQIVDFDTSVTAEDVDDPTADPLLLESRVITRVDNNQILTVYANRVEIQQLQFATNVISNPTTNENIRLETNGTGKVEVDYAHQMNHTLGTPAVVDDATLIYGNTPGAEGGSGVYFVNRQTTGEALGGELISKRKALTFSLIF